MSSFFKKIGDFFEDLWDLIANILTYILIIAAVILTVMVLVFAWPMSWLVLALLCTVAAFIVDPETASQIIGSIGEALGETAEAVAGIIGEVSGGVATGLMSSPIGTILLVVGGVWLFSKLSSGDSKGSAENDSIKSSELAESGNSSQIWVPSTDEGGYNGGY